jgi:hypothetical protein
VEWIFFRPFHYIVSRPGLEKVFGHTPHDEIKGMEQKTMEPITVEPKAKAAPDERT